MSLAWNFQAIPTNDAYIGFFSFPASGIQMKIFRQPRMYIQFEIGFYTAWKDIHEL